MLSKAQAERAAEAVLQAPLAAQFQRTQAIARKASARRKRVFIGLASGYAAGLLLGTALDAPVFAFSCAGAGLGLFLGVLSAFRSRSIQ